MINFQVISGNTDTRSPVLRVLDGSIITEKIRIIPVSETIRTVCMRIELYGCPYKGRNLTVYLLNCIFFLC